MTWGALTYIKRMMANYQQIFGEPVPSRPIHAPLEPGDHPELDETPLIEGQEVKNYWQMIGKCSGQWHLAESISWVQQ